MIVHHCSVEYVNTPVWMKIKISTFLHFNSYTVYSIYCHICNIKMLAINDLTLLHWGSNQYYSINGNT